MHAVLVAPFWMPNTLRYVAALVDLPGVRVSLLTKDTPQRLAERAPHLVRRVHAIVRVHGGLDGPGLTAAARDLAAQHGPIDRILGVLEELQLPIGRVRSALSIPGMPADVAHNFRDKARMKEVLRAAGLPVARHSRLTHADQALAFVAQVGLPIVLKPVAGVGPSPRTA